MTRLRRREERIRPFAECLTVEDVRPVAAVLPGATFEYTEIRTGRLGLLDYERAARAENLTAAQARVL
ncbi:hypothetical protein ACFYYB_35535 [Streptomyces sp. NPDC002886]|uniref:hypothetical protein n=1 Tax=Streptomyces sp. NPDC002886 TaxID=3364667 RepID=UPI0036BEBD8F